MTRQDGVVLVSALALAASSGYLAITSSYRVNLWSWVGVVIGVVVGAWWLYTLVGHGNPVAWPGAPAPFRGAIYRNEARTARLTKSLDATERGVEIGANDLAQFLRELVAARLVLHHGASPRAPLADAQDHLSPALHTFLTTERRPHLSRRTVHAFIKEIDAL